MISLPVAVHIDTFEWQLDLFWDRHRRIYGPQARERAHAVIIRRNTPEGPRAEALAWPTDVPHTLCESFFDLGLAAYAGVGVPLNIQAGLVQVLPGMPDDAVVEVLDCDMFHLRPAPDFAVGHGQLVVCDLYEAWHLRSLDANRDVIAPYFEHGGAGYNGGFVPIVGTVGTLRRLLPEWIAVHVDILARPLAGELHWWAGMFALQAACEKARVAMIARDCCYIPGAGRPSPAQHVAHYSVDRVFDKHRFPDVDWERLDPGDAYGAALLEWRRARFGQAGP